MLEIVKTLTIGTILTLSATNALAVECADKAAKSDNPPKAIIGCLKMLEQENNKLRGLLTGLQNKLGVAGIGAEIPSGAVVAFLSSESNPCPGKDWKLFDAAKGRFIVGAGKGDGLTLREIGKTGGEQNVALKENQMPKHNHAVSTGYGVNWHDGLAGGYDETGIDVLFNNPDPVIKRNGGHGILTQVISYTGGGELHNNMPPYLALYYCKRD